MSVQSIMKVGLAAAMAAALMIGWYRSTHWVETKDVGQFRLTQYWTRDLLPWGFSGRGVKRTTLCSRVSNFCLEDSHLRLNPDPQFGMPRYAFVTGFDNPNVAHFLDITTGSEVQCRNCDTPVAQLVRSPYYLEWAPSRDHALLASQGGASPWLIVLEFEPSGVTATRIAVPRDALAVHPKKPQFLNDDMLAWYACAPNCALWWYQIRDRRADHRLTPCGYSDDLAIGWEGNTPRPEFRSGATLSGSACL